MSLSDARIDSKSGWEPDASDESDEPEPLRISLIALERSKLICAVMVVFSSPLSRVLTAAWRIDRPMVAAAAMIATMMAMRILRPLLRMTLRHALRITNIVVL